MDNEEFTYYWDKEDFSEFFNFDTWDNSLLQVTEIAYINSTYNSGMYGRNVIDPSKIDSISCEYNINNFTKVFMTELTITCYDYMSTEHCLPQYHGKYLRRMML